MDKYQGCGSQYFGHTTFSQHGEDLAFCSIFHSLGIDKPSYLDIGANHPFHISNTALLYSRGSRGVNIDANPNVIAEFKKHRPEDTNVNVGVAKEESILTFYLFDKFSGLNTFSKEHVKKYPQLKVTEMMNIKVVTATTILNEYFPKVAPDLFSIDVEGLDIEVIATIDFNKHRPKVICSEIWPHESESTIKYLDSFGYEVLCRMGANLIWVQKTDIPKLKI